MYRPASRAVCRTVNLVSLYFAAVINCDHSLPAHLKATRAASGEYATLMIDGGAGKSSMSPFYDDFYSFSSTVSIPHLGAFLVAPARRRPLARSTWLLSRAMAESMSILKRVPATRLVRWFVSSPRSPVASLGITSAPRPWLSAARRWCAHPRHCVEDDHFWTKAVILPPHRDPHLPLLRLVALRFFGLSTGPRLVPSQQLVVVSWTACRLVGR
jgi:hypothetical protein